VVVCGAQRRRADSLSFVREEAVKEAMKHMVTALDALEGLESRFEDVTDEADLKILQGYKGLQSNFVSTVTKLGLVPIAPSEFRCRGVCVLIGLADVRRLGGMRYL
jgi:molecular chaperone GrpE (heat shock protein)